MRKYKKGGNTEDTLTPKIEEPEELIKEVKVQSTGRQLVVQIPALVAEALNINKGDTIIFKVPLSNPREYSIKLRKIK